MNKEPKNEIQYMIAILDNLLHNNRQSRIQENPDFNMDKFSYEENVIYTLQKDGCISLRLAWSSAGVDIGVNEFYEVHSVAYEEIKADSHQYEDYLADLLFNPVIIENCSFGLRCYYVKKANGQNKLIRKIHFGVVSMLFPFLPSLRIGCRRIEFASLYK